MYRSYNVFECIANRSLAKMEIFTGMVKSFFGGHGEEPDYAYAVYKGVIEKQHALIRDKLGYYSVNKGDFLTLVINFSDKQKLIEFSQFCNSHKPDFLMLKGTKIEVIDKSLSYIKTRTLSPIVVTRNKSGKFPFELTQDILQQEVNKAANNVQCKLLRNEYVRDKRNSESTVSNYIVGANIAELELTGEPEEIAKIRFRGLGRKRGGGYGFIK